MRDAGLEHLYSGWHAVAESCRVCKLQSVRTTQFLGKELEGQLEWHVVNVCDAFPRKLLSCPGGPVGFPLSTSDTS